MRSLFFFWGGGGLFYSDNHSKASKFKRQLYKYHPSFSKICRVGEQLKQFFVLLYDCVPRLS